MRLLKRQLKKLYIFLRFPYTRVKVQPHGAPSIKSIYYRVNQLGKNKPVGLPREQAVVYHELPFPELKLRYRRKDLDERMQILLNAIELKDKIGFDIGCALGGLTFGLQKQGAEMLGIERDKPAYEVAVEIEKYYNTGAKFINEEISTNTLTKALKKMNCKSFDFTIWLSSFNWVAGANSEETLKQLLFELSLKSEVLIADSAIGGKGQKFLDEIGIKTNQNFVDYVLLNSDYSNVTKLHTYTEWYGRSLYMFKKS